MFHNKSMYLYSSMVVCLSTVSSESHVNQHLGPLGIHECPHMNRFLNFDKNILPQHMSINMMEAKGQWIFSLDSENIQSYKEGQIIINR